MDARLGMFKQVEIYLSLRAGAIKFLILGVFLLLCQVEILKAQTFRAASSGTAPSGATTITINKPTGTIYGDVLIAVIAVRPHTSIISVPSGWTLVSRIDQSAGAPNSQAIYWKAAEQSETSSYSWAFDSSTGAVGGILSFYNINQINPVHIYSGQATAAGLTHVAPSITPTVNNTMVMTAHSFGSSATWTPPTGMTEALDVANLAVPNAGGISMEVNYAVQTAAGSSGTKTATASAESDAGVAHIIALLPRSATFNAIKTGNWSDKTIWATNRFGTIATSTGSATVTGSGTLFSQDLVAGDVLYNSSFALIGTVASIQSNTQVTLTSNALISLSSGASYKSNSSPSQWDDHYIGVLNGTTGVTVTVDNTSVNCNTLTIEAVNGSINYNLDIPTGKTVNVFGAALLKMPNQGGAANNVNVSGAFNAVSLTMLASTAGPDRISQINISDGTANISSDIIVSSNSNSKVNATGTGTLNIGGNFLQYNNDATPTSFGTASTISFATTSNLNFNGSNKQQTLLAHGTYGNIFFNNTGSNVATLNGNITTTNVKGNVEIQSGAFTNQGAAGISSLNATSSGFTVTGNTGKSFGVSDFATIYLAGTTTFPTGFSTVALQPNSTVDYVGTTQTVSPQNYGNLTVSAGTTSRTVTMSNSGVIGIAGNFNPSAINNTYNITGSTVSYNGSGNQTLPSNFNSYNNLTVNNSGSEGSISLSSPVTLNNNLTLTNGKLFTTSTNILTVGLSATITLNAPTSQDNSFVSGPMKHVVASTSSTTKVFPVGKSNTLHKAELTVTQSSTTSTEYTAEFFKSSANSLGYTLPSTLDRISNVSYWIISKGTGSTITNGTVKLEYFSSDGVSDANNLRIAKDNGAGAWLDLGGIGTSSPSGSITSTNNFTTFSAFALANNNEGGNSLPITLSYFKADNRNSSVTLSWETITENNNSFFTLEKSKNGRTFEQMAIEKGSGNSSETRYYSVIDEKPYYGTSYYRLKQTDYNGSSSYSQIVSATVNGQGIMSVSPNPIKSGEVPKLFFNQLLELESKYVEIGISDLRGKVLLSGNRLLINNKEFVELEFIKTLRPGIYLIEIRGGIERLRYTLIVI